MSVLTDRVVSELRHPAFDKAAYERYRLARRLGEAVSGMDDPSMVRVADAAHMRADDYVIGLVVGGSARAYPLWVVDNYHVVNDRVDGERFFVASCERCQSGSAFRAEVEGNPDREPVFRSIGFLNATLLLKDLRTGSHWIHYEGLGLDRRAAGVRLPWIPTYHMEWSDWVLLHPDTVVMVPPEDPTHPDARHGHGREEMFARAGMDAAFLPTIIGDIDRTFPENEVVLGVDGRTESVAYPLRDVQRERGVVVDRVDGEPIVVLAGPRADGFTMSAFVPTLDDRSLTFVREGDGFVDRETGSRWTIEGSAVQGPLAGRVLEPVAWFCVRWHAWIYSHRGTRLFRSRTEPAALGVEDVPELEPFDALLRGLTEQGHEVRVGEPVVSQRRPREAVASVTVYVDGDRLNLHAFETDRCARDLHAFDASWSGHPLRPRSHEGRTRRIGRLVIESDPEDRFADPTNIVPLPDSVIRWSKVLAAPALDGAVQDADVPSEPVGTGFTDMARGLRLAGFEVIDIGFLPPSQLRVGADNGIGLTIDAERFVLYRFGSVESALGYAATEPHTFAFGCYVIRSTPETMYQYQPAEVLYAGDEWVRWSTLPEDPRFRQALEGVVAQDPA
jgi:Protein of unknown function (DUF3179)